MLGRSNSVSSGRQVSANYKTLTLFVSGLVLFFISFVTSGLNVAIPMIGQEFPSNAILLSWVVTSQLLSIGVFLMPVGRISDIVGIKKIFLWGVILFTATSVIAAYSTSIIMLIAFLAIQGIGCAMIFGNSMAMLTSVYPTQERGRALGISAACVYTGMSLGPYLGGILIEHFGWRSLFFIIIPACLAAVTIVLLKIKGDWSAAKGEKFDIIGSIIVGVALIALMYGFSLLQEITGEVLTAIGILGLLAFLKWESRIKYPILNTEVFRKNRLFTFSNIANLIGYAATNAVIFLMSLYLQYIKALTPEHAGLILLAQSAPLVIFSPITGILSDRFEPRIIGTAGMILTFIGLLIFSFLTETTPVILIVVVLIIIGLGVALFITPNNNAIMGSVIPKYYAVASSTAATLRQIGQTFSLGITMIIMSVVIGRVIITSEYYPSFLASTKLAFGIFTVLALGGIFFSLFRGKTR